MVAVVLLRALKAIKFGVQHERGVGAVQLHGVRGEQRFVPSKVRHTAAGHHRWNPQSRLLIEPVGQDPGRPSSGFWVVGIQLAEESRQKFNPFAIAGAQISQQIRIGSRHGVFDQAAGDGTHDFSWRLCCSRETLGICWDSSQQSLHRIDCRRGRLHRWERFGSGRPFCRCRGGGLTRDCRRYLRSFGSHESVPKRGIDFDRGGGGCGGFNPSG